MKISTSMTFNGRPFQPRNLERAVMDAARKKVPEAAQRHLESIRCPVHGRTARARALGPDRMSVFDFCCERLREEIQRQLR